MTDPVQESLDKQLANLVRDIEPPRNLWPGIFGRLVNSPQRARPRTRPLMYAAAAGVIGACLASALTWAVLHGRAASPRIETTARATSFDESRNPRYIAARASLEVTFRERLALLDPVTRGRIEARLAVIRQAHEDIRKALAGDPACPVLEQLWQSTWHDDLDLYDYVVRATQPTMARI